MEYTYSGLENRISAEHLKAGEVVKVTGKGNGYYYLHLIWSLKPGDRFLIGNNHNHPNGVISRNNIFGKVVEIL